MYVYLNFFITTVNSDAFLIDGDRDTGGFVTHFLKYPYFHCFCHQSVQENILSDKPDW